MWKCSQLYSIGMRSPRDIGIYTNTSDLVRAADVRVLIYRLKSGLTWTMFGSKKTQIRENARLPEGHATNPRRPDMLCTDFHGVRWKCKKDGNNNNHGYTCYGNISWQFGMASGFGA